MERAHSLVFVSDTAPMSVRAPTEPEKRPCYIVCYIAPAQSGQTEATPAKIAVWAGITCLSSSTLGAGSGN